MKFVTKTKLVIYGCSSFTKSIISLANKIDEIDVVAICVDDEYIPTLPKTFCNLEVLGFDDAMRMHPDASYILAIGYKSMRKREVVYNKLRACNLHIATLISPNASVSSDRIGPGCIVFDGAVIEQGAIIHDNVTIWSNVTICHDVEIGCHCFIAANATLGGFSKVGKLTFVGFSTTLIDSIKVGNECLLGASSLINFNIMDLSKCYGVPVRLIGHIDPQLGVNIT
ncbi:acetyltransferase [Shewanella chilikensis]|uniref:acetyltransferase n=1 Tax=Shewanella chilikensis TaxID=558541 RepID=UPI003A97BE89